MGVGDDSSRHTRFPSGMFYSTFRINQFNTLRQVAALNRAPKIRFKDLETVVDTKLTYNTFPFDYRTDFIKITEDTILTPITVVMKNSDMTFQDVDGVKKAEVNVFGRISTITGRSVQVFEEVVRQISPEALFKSALEKRSSTRPASPCGRASTSWSWCSRTSTAATWEPSTTASACQDFPRTSLPPAALSWPNSWSGFPENRSLPASS